jgi:hypothetical protein
MGIRAGRTSNSKSVHAKVAEEDAKGAKEFEF